MERAGNYNFEQVGPSSPDCRLKSTQTKQPIKCLQIRLFLLLKVPMLYMIPRCKKQHITTKREFNLAKKTYWEKESMLTRAFIIRWLAPLEVTLKVASRIYRKRISEEMYLRNQHEKSKGSFKAVDVLDLNWVARGSVCLDEILQRTQRITEFLFE